VDRDRVPAVVALDPQDAQARQAHHQEDHSAPEQGAAFFSWT
jgi:hypothetical protein